MNAESNPGIQMILIESELIFFFFLKKVMQERNWFLIKCDFYLKNELDYLSDGCPVLSSCLHDSIM